MAAYTFETETTNGSLMITGLNVEDGVTEVIIPSTIDGKPVTVIGREAFKGCSGLTSVEISKECEVSNAGFPKTVKIIKV